MKRVTSVSGGQGTNYSETGLFVEQGIAYDQSRAAALLFMTGMGVEGNGDEVPLPGTGCFHLPGLSAHRLAPIRFFGLVALGYA